MPFLPRETERRLIQPDNERRPPDVSGEEGFLYKEDPYWIKRWNYSHLIKIAERDRHQERSLLPPHWAKYQFWQAKVIHDLFPEDTVEVVGAYDTRIRREADGSYSFDPLSGKPVTISRDVPVVGKLANKYQGIIHALYRDTAGDYDKIKQIPEDDLDSTVRSRYDKRWDSTDEQLRQMIGAPEFDLFQGRVEGLSDQWDFAHYANDLELRVRQVNPHSRILPLLKAGIVPVHPAINFVPREPQAGERHTPTGTFLELQFASFIHLQQYIGVLEPAARRRIEPKVKKLMSLNDIVGMFASFIENTFTRDKFDFLTKEGFTVLFQIHDRILKIASFATIKQFSRIQRRTATWLDKAMNESSSAQEATDKLNTLLVKVDTWVEQSK